MRVSECVVMQDLLCEHTRGAGPPEWWSSNKEGRVFCLALFESGKESRIWELLYGV